MFLQLRSVNSVETSECLFGLQDSCADGQDSAFALSLTLAMAIVMPWGPRALAPADTLGICCGGESNRLTGGLIKQTLWHINLDAELFAS